jgi:phosphate transport system substrate-binding protein
MRINRTVRLALTSTAVVIAALSVAVVPALAGVSGAKAGTDPYLASDTHLNWPVTIGGAGSTFAAPLQNAAQALYQARVPNATINGYQAVGSGTGEADILKQVVNWGGTDVPMAQSDILKDESSGDNYQLSQFVQVPIGLGGVAIAYNIPSLGHKTSLVLRASTLAQIYLGKITTWNNPAIKKLNPKVNLPDSQIIVVARADSSGTTYIFTNFMNTAAPKVWKTLPSKTPLTLPSGGIAGSGNPGVAADIENTPNSIGYVEYSYVLLNPSLLKGVASIFNEEQKVVAPSPATIAAAAAEKPTISSTNFSIVWQWGKDSYPICGYTWAVVWQSQPNFNIGTLLVKYLDWLSHSGAVDGTEAGQDVAQLQGYVPLPANIQALARTELLKVTGPSGETLLTTNGS